MKKIPTLFVRVFAEDGGITGIREEVTPGLEWVLSSRAVPTVKWDGACAAIINGELYRRYDAKHGKVPPEGAIPCQPEADPVTGHWPHWLKCREDAPADKWYFEAFAASHLRDTYLRKPITTYEAVGLHFNGNPYHFDNDILIPHGQTVLPLRKEDRTFQGIHRFLSEHTIEGIVFWFRGEPVCKIKRTDFGLLWPLPEEMLYTA